MNMNLRCACNPSSRSGEQALLWSPCGVSLILFTHVQPADAEVCQSAAAARADVTP